MKRFALILSCLLCVIVISWKIPLATIEYNIVDFGAKGDGVTVNTKIINDVIVKCSAGGGGVVTISAGTFISGTVLLLNNVNLHLSAGAVLKGSMDTADYMPIKDSRQWSEGYKHYGLVLAINAKNISITGQGEINGNGTHFMNGIDKPHNSGDFERKYTRQGENFMKKGDPIEDGPVSYNYRVAYMINFEHCENIQLLNIYLKDSPEWTVRISDSEQAKVSGVTIDNNLLIPNTDGINCSNSRNVSISDCNISTGDDAIIVNGFSDHLFDYKKDHSTPDKNAVGNKTDMAEYITVTNCVLSSRSACIRVGDGQHPIRNLIFSNLVMHTSNRGIGIFSRTDAQIENVIFSNIIMKTRLFSGHWWGKGEPIHISAVKDYSATTNAGKIKNIRFSNIIADSETGMVINGSASSFIEDVLMEKVKLTIHRGKHSDTYGGNFDLRPAFPADSALFKHDIPGLYAQYVKNFTLSGMEINWDEGLPNFFTNGIEVHYFNGLVIEKSTSRSAFNTPGLSAIKLKSGTGEIVRYNIIANGAAGLVRVK